MRYATPFRLLAAAFALGFAIFVAAIWGAVSQPFIGLDLRATPDGTVAAISDGEGPSEGILQGSTLARVVADDLFPITPLTVLEEPDTLPSFDAMAAFATEQGRLRRALASGEVRLEGVGPQGQDFSVPVTARAARPISDLPVAFWLQVLSGFAATVIGGWVWSLNPRATAQIGLFLSGVGLQFSASAAAIYSTRELALSQAAYEWLTVLNNLGTASFGLGLISVFLSYPKAVASTKVLWALSAIAPVWYATVFGTNVIKTPAVGVYLPVLVMLVIILVAIGYQVWANRADPVARAALRMLAFGVIAGAGTFTLTRAVPVLLGLPLGVSQGVLFPLIALVYASVALAVLRYRLFDMPRWSSLMLFYFIGACLLIALDAVLIFVLALDRAPALGLALLVVGMLYLPLRDRAMALLMRRSGRQKDGAPRVGLLASADYVTRAPGPEIATERWTATLVEMFDPLEIAPAPGPQVVGQVNIIDYGRALDVPPPMAGVGAVRMSYPKRGQRLFTGEDRTRLTELIAMIAELLRGQEAYQTGVTTERARIARDMHDNISITLLGALHSSDTGRKDALVRETLSDLRRIIANDTSTQSDLGVILSELRLSIAETLVARGISLDWPVAKMRDTAVSEETGHALRSVLREAINNVIKHANASEVRVAVASDNAQVFLSIEDDGNGLRPSVPAAPGSGNGMGNMRSRIEDLGGHFDVQRSEAGGVRLTAWVNRFPAQSPEHVRRIS